MRNYMLPVDAPPEAIDLCGTGGDGHGTLNISTAVISTVAGGRQRRAGVDQAWQPRRFLEKRRRRYPGSLGREDRAWRRHEASKVLAKTGIVFAVRPDPLIVTPP